MARRSLADDEHAELEAQRVTERVVWIIILLFVLVVACFTCLAWINHRNPQPSQENPAHEYEDGPREQAIREDDDDCLPAPDPLP